MIFKKGDNFCLQSGFWQVQEGYFVKQRILPSGHYGNIGIYCPNDVYGIAKDYDNYRLFPLSDGKISRVDAVQMQQITKQLHDYEDLLYILNCPIRQRIYLFIQWGYAKNFIELLTQEEIANFLSTTRRTVAEHFKEMREHGLITL